MRKIEIDSLENYDENLWFNDDNDVKFTIKKEYNRKYPTLSQKVSRNSLSPSGVEVSGLLDFFAVKQIRSENESDDYFYRMRKIQLTLASFALNDLTEIQRKVVMMTIANKKQKEVAKILGVDNSTVCRHLAAAKKKFNKIMKIYEMLKPFILYESDLDIYQ